MDSEGTPGEYFFKAWKIVISSHLYIPRTLGEEYKCAIQDVNLEPILNLWCHSGYWREQDIE